MKAYGVPRTRDLLELDVMNLRRYGFSSRYLGAVAKARVRRHWKRQARRAAHAAIHAELKIK